MENSRVPSSLEAPEFRSTLVTESEQAQQKAPHPTFSHTMQMVGCQLAWLTLFL